MQHTDLTSSQALLKSVLSVVRQQVMAEMQPKTATPAQTKRLLTVAEAAEFMGRSETAMRQLIYKRLVPVVRFGRNVRVDIRDLEHLIEENRM